MKSMMKWKRIASVVLAAILALSLTACSSEGMANDAEAWYDDASLAGIQNAPAGMESPKADGEVDVENESVGDENTPTIVENPFVSVAENAVSTFSADVDTASYAYFRKLVNAGYGLEELIGSGTAFRTEEFINYFRYDAAEPAEGELFGVQSEISPCPWNEETVLFRLTLQAEKAKEVKGNNLVFLIDVSGSMNSQDKLPLLKRAFSYLVGQLGEDDVVSIVTYSGREAVVLEGCQGSKGDLILKAINALEAGGSTNGEAGLTRAYQIAEAYYIEGGNNRIIMASDGDLNVGISSQSELTAYIEQKRDQGVYLSVLGFGTGNYRDSRMEALADNGNGVYYYIDGEREAEKVFGTDILSTLYTVAEDVKLQIEFSPERVESYRLIGYENRMLNREDFEDDTKDAGEVGASHQVTVCYEMKLCDVQPDDGSPILTLRVRHKTPGGPISLLNEYPMGDELLREEASEDQRFIAALIEACMILRQSEHIGDVTVKHVIVELSSLDTSAQPDRAELLELLRQITK